MTNAGTYIFRLYFSPLSVTHGKQRDRKHPFSSFYSSSRAKHGGGWGGRPTVQARYHLGDLVDVAACGNRSMRIQDWYVGTFSQFIERVYWSIKHRIFLFQFLYRSTVVDAKVPGSWQFLKTCSGTVAGVDGPGGAYRARSGALERRGTEPSDRVGWWHRHRQVNPW